MKKLLPLCLSLMLALVLAIPAAASSAPAAQPANGVSVQVNGKNISFPNASPEVTNGRTMVPMRAVLETLGATVDYDADTQTVTATLGDITLTHVIDTNTIDMGDSKTLTMDTTSYVTNGSTLVPLRFFSQALGYEVYWDEGQRTAVVIDKAAFVSETDKSFSTLNALQSKAPAISGNLAMDTSVTGEIKLLDGTTDTPLPFSAKTSVLYGDKAVNIDGSANLAAFSTLLENGDNPMLAALTPVLKDLSFQMIYGESVWVNVPALTAAFQRSDDMWIKADTYDIATLTSSAAAVSGSTIGSALYDAVAYMDADVPVNIYDDLSQAVGYMKMVIGDDTFTQNADGYSWKIDEAKSAMLAEAIGEDPESFSITAAIDIKADGSGTFSVNLKADGISVSVSGTSTAASSTVKVQAVIPGVCEVSVECSSSVKAGGKSPAAEPPAGAGIVNLEDLLNAAGLSDVVGGADGPTGIFTSKAA